MLLGHARTDRPREAEEFAAEMTEAEAACPVSQALDGTEIEMSVSSEA